MTSKYNSNVDNLRYIKHILEDDMNSRLFLNLIYFVLFANICVFMSMVPIVLHMHFFDSMFYVILFTICIFMSVMFVILYG